MHDGDDSNVAQGRGGAGDASLQVNRSTPKLLSTPTSSRPGSSFIST